MSEKKELTKVERYAVNAAVEKIKIAQGELQSLLQEIAVELGIDIDDPLAGVWGISADMKYLERRGEIGKELSLDKKKQP